MERFEKIVLDFGSLAIFAKRSILDVWQGAEYASVELLIPNRKILKCI